MKYFRARNIVVELMNFSNKYSSDTELRER
jgi:hypothetical protein